MLFRSARVTARDLGVVHLEGDAQSAHLHAECVDLHLLCPVVDPLLVLHLIEGLLRESHDLGLILPEDGHLGRSHTVLHHVDAAYDLHLILRLVDVHPLHKKALLDVVHETVAAHLLDAGGCLHRRVTPGLLEGMVTADLRHLIYVVIDVGVLATAAVKVDRGVLFLVGEGEASHVQTLGRHHVSRDATVQAQN